MRPPAKPSAQANSRARSNAALLKASSEGDEFGVYEALQAGADVNARDSQQRTPLLLATSGPPDDKGVPNLRTFDRQLRNIGRGGEVSNVVQLLLKAGAQVNLADAKGMTALFIAIINGNLALCREFIRRKANVNYQNPRDGTTAIVLAIATHSAEILEMLLAAGAAINQRIPDLPVPLLVLVLVPLGKKASEDESAGATPASFGRSLLLGDSNPEETQIAIMNRLLRAGADPNEQGKFGLTPLIVASMVGSPQQIRFLLRSGAKVAITATDGTDALMAAAHERRVDNARVLLDAGISVQNANRGGTTALMTAAEKGSFALVQMLLRAGAPANVANSEDKTARDIAFENHNTAIVNLLKSAPR